MNKYEQLQLILMIVIWMDIEAVQNILTHINIKWSTADHTYAQRHGKTNLVCSWYKPNKLLNIY